MIDLYTAATPNGYKVSVCLEELGLAYNPICVDLINNEQKQPWFLKISPNGRIPAIIDHDNDDFAIFESGAIMVYLAERAGQLLPPDEKARSRVMQWLMFQMGGIGPMMGQANVFYRYFPEKIPAVIERYQNESKRLLGVLDGQLAEHEYLAGDYSIADIANFCWARIYHWPGLNIDDMPHLQRWLELIEQRPAVQRGVAVPEALDPAALVEAAQEILQK